MDYSGFHKTLNHVRSYGLCSVFVDARMGSVRVHGCVDGFGLYTWVYPGVAVLTQG